MFQKDNIKTFALGVLVMLFMPIIVPAITL